MANPPFNVDEVDADKVKGDKRLPFGLPGVNKSKKVSNANYLWLQYFYSYLNENGRAGVVMSSQASSAGRDEAKVRQKLVESGAVDVMIDIRGNFFYTRTVPCQLWFFDRAKERDENRRDHVLSVGRDGVHVVQDGPALGEDGPGISHRVLQTLLPLTVLLDAVGGVGHVDVGRLYEVPDAA